MEGMEVRANHLEGLDCIQQARWGGGGVVGGQLEGERK
jgi:hypothetical protein